MEQIIHPRASKNSLVVKDKTRKGKGWFLLWSLTRQSPVTDCQGIFHNYLASKLNLQQSWLVPVFGKGGVVDDDATSLPPSIVFYSN